MLVRVELPTHRAASRLADHDEDLAAGGRPRSQPVDRARGRALGSRPLAKVPTPPKARRIQRRTLERLLKRHSIRRITAEQLQEILRAVAHIASRGSLDERLSPIPATTYIGCTRVAFGTASRRHKDTTKGDESKESTRRMAMNFEELDDTTRRYMLQEFEAELASDNPYFGQNLSVAGRSAFPELMRTAINGGTEETLGVALNSPGLWKEKEPYTLKGVRRLRRINVRQASERLALTEFNTCLVRGLARRLMDEGEEHCQVYRAAQPKWEPAECTAHENQVFRVQEIYEGHRARYWPVANDAALSIPFGPGCHHTIRRLRA